MEHIYCSESVCWFNPLHAPSTTVITGSALPALSLAARSTVGGAPWVVSPASVKCVTPGIEPARSV